MIFSSNLKGLESEEEGGRTEETDCHWVFLTFTGVMIWLFLLTSDFVLAVFFYKDIPFSDLMNDSTSN